MRQNTLPLTFVKQNVSGFECVLTYLNQFRRFFFCFFFFFVFVFFFMKILIHTEENKKKKKKKKERNVTCMFTVCFL